MTTLMNTLPQPPPTKKNKNKKEEGQDEVSNLQPEEMRSWL